MFQQLYCELHVEMKLILKIPGMYSILFASPEAVIGMPEWRDVLLSAPHRVVAVAVDEAHCVSKW